MSNPRAKDLFLDALDLEPEVRLAFVDRECGDDESLRTEVLDLLAAHDDMDRFLEASAEVLVGVEAAPEEVIDAIGDRVGAFELIEQLGEGGFAVVWRARQEEPVRREVALKILKVGTKSAGVAARFARERDTLAGLHHPGIATIFDAGATEDERPWFAMELVSGQAITDYCDDKRLNVRARLQLFGKVCLAIQHAHLNGIAHRDIKPSNVLVTEVDGRPVPQIIDFGIATLLEEGEGGATVPDGDRRLVGTIEYISPEQLESRSGGVDARTDVYSLTVLLHDLLCGNLPFEVGRFGAKSRPELLRQIRDRAPSRPSDTVARLEPAEVDRVARARASTPRRLAGTLRGELDWIVLHGLEKDPEQRYATPVGLAKDVERYLRRLPVEAGPGTRLYLFRKFAQRNRVALLAGSLALASLLAGTVFALYGLVQARESEADERMAREQAERNEARAQLETEKTQLALQSIEQMLTSADPRRQLGRNYTVREMLDQFDRDLGAGSLPDPTVEARLRRVLGVTYSQLGVNERAMVHLERARDLQMSIEDADPKAVMSSRVDWAWILYDVARLDEALTEIDIVIDYWRGIEDERGELAVALDARTLILAQTDRLEEAEANGLESLRIVREVYGERHPHVARALSSQAQVLTLIGRLEESEAAIREAIEILLENVPEDHPEVLVLQRGLALTLGSRGRIYEAEQLHRSVLERRLVLHGENHPEVANARLDLAWMLHMRSQHEEAVELLRPALIGLRASLGEEHPRVTEAINRLGIVLYATGESDEAKALIRQAGERFRTLPGHPIAGAIAIQSTLAVVLIDEGDWEAGLEEFRLAVELAKSELPHPHPVTVQVMSNLAQVLGKLGHIDEAEAVMVEAIADGEQLWDENHPQLAHQRRQLELLRAAK